MLHLALIAVAHDVRSVSLTPFVDDGGTKTQGLEPTLLALAGSGTTKTGTLRVGDKGFPLRVRIQGTTATLQVAGKTVPWNRRNGALPDGSPIAAYEGMITVPLGSGTSARYAVRYLASTTQAPDFAEVRNRILVRLDFGFLGKATFAGRTYPIGIRGGDPARSALFIDRDGDGHLGSVEQELYDLHRPFNIGGQTYRLGSFRPFGSPTVTFVRSPNPVVERALPSELKVGKVVPAYVGKSLDGKRLAFPGAFRGKVVMLDVWATWCGPCRAEIPYMKEVCQRFRGKGFEIVSLSIDDVGMQGKVAAFAKKAGMSWLHGFEGMNMASPVCQRYGIHAIPFSLLVDGTTGRILAKGAELRGPYLMPTVAWEMAKRS